MEMNRFGVERKDEENAAVGDMSGYEAKEFLILLIKKRFYYREKKKINECTFMRNKSRITDINLQKIKR